MGAVTSLGAVGGLAGAWLSGRLVKRAPGRLLVIAGSWIMVAVVVGIGLVPNAWAIGVLLSVTFFLAAPLNVIFSTHEAQTIPDAMVGTVTSAMNFGAASINWLGAIEAGFLASRFSPATTTLIFAGVLAVLAVSTHVARGLQVLNEPLAESD